MLYNDSCGYHYYSNYEAYSKMIWCCDFMVRHVLSLDFSLNRILEWTKFVFNIQKIIGKNHRSHLAHTLYYTGRIRKTGRFDLSNIRSIVSSRSRGQINRSYDLTALLLQHKTRSYFCHCEMVIYSSYLKLCFRAICWNSQWQRIFNLLYSFPIWRFW